MRSDRDWLDVANLVVLVAAFLAAASAAQQAERLATETLDATAHSDSASQKQHLDTLAALKVANDANVLSKETADRQARDTASALALSKQAADAATKAAETNVATERARLFLTNASFVRTSEKDPNPKISFQIANLGKTSALVTAMQYDCKVASNPLPPIPTYINNPHSTMRVISSGGLYTIPSNCVMDNPSAIRILPLLRRMPNSSYSQDMWYSKTYSERSSLSILAFSTLARMTNSSA